MLLHLRLYSYTYETALVIEAITNYREPNPGIEAMYLLMPTSQNIERIIKDFSDGNQQYAGAHLFFIDGAYEMLNVLGNLPADHASGLAEPLFNKVTSSPAEPYLKTLQELYINFWGAFICTSL